MQVISVPFCINIVWFVRMDVTWRQNALICLLSYNLSFMHHYWQQLMTHVETNLPLALGGQSAVLLWFSNHYEPRRQRELWTSHFFRFLCRQYTSTKLKCLISTNYSLFYLFLITVANNLTLRKFAYTRQFKRVGQIVMKFKRTQIHFISDVSTTVAVLVV